MRCLVRNCGNRKYKRAPGISFHRFPTRLYMRKKWLDVLGLKDFRPDTNAAVCSDHFSENDTFYFTDGVVRLQPGAVPSLNLCETMDKFLNEYSTPIARYIKQEHPYARRGGVENVPPNEIRLSQSPVTDQNTEQKSIDETEEMFNEPTCRLCLSTEGSLEEIFTSPRMAQKLFECTNIELINIKGLPSCICEMCKSELISWSRFRKKCLKTENFLKISFPELYVNVKSEGNDLEEYRNAEDSEEITNVEYIEDLKIESVCEPESDEESEEEEERVLDIEFETIKEEKLENELQNEDTIEENTAEDEEDDSEAENNIKSDEYILKKDLKANSICREVLKTSDGKKIKYHTRCQVCGKLQQNIKQHMLIHTGELPFKCPYCSRGFRQRSNLKHHIYSHTGEKPYECKLCLKAFSAPASLLSHMVQHTGERRYRCEFCGKAFGHSHTLGAHIRTHTQDSRYICDFCPKRFLYKHAFKKHIRTHTGERPYQCDKCPKCFSSSSNLKTHQRVHTRRKRPCTK